MYDDHFNITFYCNRSRSFFNLQHKLVGSKIVTFFMALLQHFSIFLYMIVVGQ